MHKILSTLPIQEVLPNEINNELITILSDFAETLEETRNFGTHVLTWDLKTAKGGDENIPIIQMFRNIIENVDAISILVKNSCIDASKPLLRTLLENFLQLEYLLENDSIKRSLNFLVWDFHRQLHFAKKVKKGTKENLDFLLNIRSDSSLTKNHQIPDFEDVDAKIENINNLLAMPIYKHSVNEYQKLLLRKKSIDFIKWYEFNQGPSSIKRIAKHLKRDAFYEIFYSSLSKSTHGNDIINGKISSDKNGKLSVIQIRFAKDAQMIVQQWLWFVSHEPLKL